MESITFQQFLNAEFRCCFVCGDLKYCQTKINGAIYRFCAKCLKKAKTKNFIRIQLASQKKGDGM